jgi:hypothetical protein
VLWTDFIKTMGSKPFSPCAHLFLDDQMDHVTVITLALSSCDLHDSQHKISATQVSRCNLGNLIFSISLAALQNRLAWEHSANAWSKDSEVDLHTGHVLLSLTWAEWGLSNPAQCIA